MVEINNLTKQKINEGYLRMAAEKTLKFLGAKGDISLAIVGEKRMRDLNRGYRKKDRSTDVLSFAEADTVKPSKEIADNLPEVKGFLGEIIFCPAYIKKSAKFQKKSYKIELTEVLIHGILHLLGYDHEETAKKTREMFVLQERILDTIR